MIEHASPRLANCQQLDELAMRAAGEPVRHQGRALRRLLRHRGEPLEHACGSERLEPPADRPAYGLDPRDRKSTRLNSSHSQISYAVFCLKKKTTRDGQTAARATLLNYIHLSGPPY